MTPLHAKAGLIVAGGAAWGGSLLAALHNSMHVALGQVTPSTQLADHLPLLLAVCGGVGGVFVAAAKVIGLYRAGIDQVRGIVKSELEAHTAREESQVADILRRVAKVERIVDSRGRPPSAPYAVVRAPEDSQP